jgi:PIN domain nuclease of toxin-antitoxin system
MSVVLDASAVLAVLNKERGADQVVDTLADAVLLTVNYAEVVSKLVEQGLASGLACALVEGIGATVVDYDKTLAARTGELRAATRERGLSLADRACLALAERERAAAVTADKNWAGLELGIDVRLIR